MTNEKTITICGKEVKMRYCAATETGFERLAEKSIGDIDFTKQDDLIRLSVVDAPIDSSEILTDAKPKELIEMFKTILELRAAWYEVPAVIKPEMEESDKKEKNA